MQDYSLTVIIPNYNKSEYIIKCIDSVLMQTFIPNEIIVVDDCSTDDSVSKIEAQYSNNEIVKVVCLLQNGGVSNARNVGAKYATSDYITFLDSDDYYYGRNKLEVEMKIIRDYKEQLNEDVIAYSALVRCGINSVVDEYLPLNCKYYSNGDIYFNLLSLRKLLFRDYCVKKEVFLSVGGYSYPKNFYEDLDLLIRLSKVSKFYFSGVYGTAYRKTPSGLSSRTSQDHRHEVRSIVDSYLNKEPLSVILMILWLKFAWKVEYRVMRSIEKFKCKFNWRK